MGVKRKFTDVVSWTSRLGGLLALICALAPLSVRGQIDYERPPIDYLHASVHDHVAQLQQRLESGEATLDFDEQSGYLPSVLRALEISPSSQLLVFSKTSFQLARISPRRPRAIYFNDNTYIGWVQRGDVIEVSSVDPQQGAVFYTLSQKPSEQPRFERQTHNCLVCHGSSHTQGVPGHFVRSVFPDRSGQPVLSAGTFRTDFTSPLRERWGGWYVTGTHGAQRHMGNVTVGAGHTSADQAGQHGADPIPLDVEAGANVIDLKPLLNISPYLTPHSDLVALMVLEHQTAAHNGITAANYSARMTRRDALIMNEALQRDAQYESESTQRRYAAAAEKMLDVLLLVNEAPLTEPVAGTSEFARHFQQLGPVDRQGRSLRALDLKTRLFRYPCSYLIYSGSFAALPPEVRDRVLQRLWSVLTSADTSEKFQHLAPADRQAIREILQDTQPDLPAYWRSSAGDGT